MNRDIHPPKNKAQNPTFTQIWLQSSLQGLNAWWQFIDLAALAMIAALSPASYRSGLGQGVLWQLYRTTASVLPWFAVMSSLISLVLIRIVVVTASSYGLSHYALDMVVRVLVLELLPLSAALFVAMRCMMPLAAQVGQLQAAGQMMGWNRGEAPLRISIVPRFLAGMFAVWALATVSALFALVMAYWVVFGFSPWGLGTFSHMVGQVFYPAIVVLLFVKTLLFSIAVAAIPLSASLNPKSSSAMRSNEGVGSAPPGLVRLLVVILLIEVATLLLRFF